MIKYLDVANLSIIWYDEPLWGFSKLGKGRYQLNLYRLSLRLEIWFIRY